ncbi:MAG: hypothetical protein CSA97_01905 [Bacteroidetes bacterium]|nr:MAG: hypothetical protein CSA97_01905 [Bacteroidota bacterium]
MGHTGDGRDRGVAFYMDLLDRVEAIKLEFQRLVQQGGGGDGDRRAHMDFLRDELIKMSDADSISYYASTHGTVPHASNGRDSFYIRPEEARFALMLLNALEVEQLPLTERSPLFRTLGEYDILYLWESPAKQQLLLFFFGEDSVVKAIRAAWRAVDRYQFRHKNDVLRTFNSEDEERVTKLRLLNFLLSLLVVYRDGQDPEEFVENFTHEVAPQATAPVYYIEDSPQLEEARQGARQTFGYFWREVYWDKRRKESILQHAVVKMGVRGLNAEGEEVAEHVWVTVLGFDGDTVRGRLLSKLEAIEGVEAGESMEFPLGVVEDWLFSASGLAYGGFTVQYIRGQLTPAQRAQHDRDWGVEFPPLGEVRLAIGQEDHPEVLHEHPLSLLATEQLKEVLEADPSYAAGRSSQGLTRLQQEVLAGNRTLVELLLEAGADREEQSDAGKTALDYAYLMSWWHIVPLLKSE